MLVDVTDDVAHWRSGNLRPARRARGFQQPGPRLGSTAGYALAGQPDGTGGLDCCSRALQNAWQYPVESPAVVQSADAVAGPTFDRSAWAWRTRNWSRSSAASTRDRGIPQKVRTAGHPGLVNRFQRLLDPAAADQQGLLVLAIIPAWPGCRSSSACRKSDRAWRREALPFPGRHAGRVNKVALPVNINQGVLEFQCRLLPRLNPRIRSGGCCSRFWSAPRPFWLRPNLIRLWIELAAGSLFTRCCRPGRPYHHYHGEPRTGPRQKCRFSEPCCRRSTCTRNRLPITIVTVRASQRSCRGAGWPCGVLPVEGCLAAAWHADASARHWLAD